MPKIQFSLILTVILNVFAPSFSKADTGKVLESFIDKDKILEKGVYIIENNVKVTKDATLTVRAGSKLLFRKGASIKIYGGLLLDGKTNSFIDISSEDIQNEGFGIIISDVNTNASINIYNANFSYLLIPLHFEKNWARKEVNIENNSFQHIITGEAAILIKKPDEFTIDTINFKFKRNNFIENNSSIFIEELESDILNLQFNYNLITSNYYYGFENGGGLSAPLSTTYNNTNGKFKTTFTGNSIFNNYLIHNTNDTIVQEINFAIRGSAEKFSLNSNFFGIKNTGAIQKTFDHFTNHQFSPYIFLEAPLKAPSDSTHGHIWKIKFNYEDLDKKNNLPVLTEPALEIEVYYNRGLLVRDGIQYISYTYFDESAKELITKRFVSGLKLDKNNKVLRFIIKDEVYINHKKGFFTIENLADNEGFSIPKIYAGKENFKTYLINNNIQLE